MIVTMFVSVVKSTVYVPFVWLLCAGSRGRYGCKTYRHYFAISRGFVFESLVGQLWQLLWPLWYDSYGCCRGKHRLQCEPRVTWSLWRRQVRWEIFHCKTWIVAGDVYGCSAWETFPWVSPGRWTCPVWLCAMLPIVWTGQFLIPLSELPSLPYELWRPFSEGAIIWGNEWGWGRGSGAGAPL